jgi:tetratricopeptide (TPR) repeat protein
MLVPEEKNIFRKDPYRPNPYTVVILIVMIIVAVSALVRISDGLDQGTINNPLAATPTPTRNTTSYLMEAEAFFAAGNITAAINSYQDAIDHNPNNGQTLAELARLQTYYSSIVTTNQKAALLEQAKTNIDLAVEIDPENSDVYAIKALVYDWYTAVEGLTEDQINEYLLDAYDASVKALTLDTQNVLALTFQAEILQDQFNFAGALQNA